MIYDTTLTTFSSFQDYNLTIRQTQQELQSLIAINKGFIIFQIFNSHKNPTETQKEVHEKDIKIYNDTIDNLEREVSKLSIDQRNTMMELEGFIQCFKNLAETYRDASYVRKRKTTSLLFSNVIINDERQVQIKVKAGLEELFIQGNGDDGIRTHV